MSPHIYSTKSAKIDGAAFAVLRNRDFAFELSRNTVGRLPAHPPVPRDHSLVPMSTAGTLPPCAPSPVAPAVGT